MTAPLASGGTLIARKSLAHQLLERTQISLNNEAVALQNDGHQCIVWDCESYSRLKIPLCCGQTPCAKSILIFNPMQPADCQTADDDDFLSGAIVLPPGAPTTYSTMEERGAVIEAGATAFMAAHGLRRLAPGERYTPEEVRTRHIPQQPDSDERRAAKARFFALFDAYRAQRKTGIENPENYPGLAAAFDTIKNTE